MILHAGSRGASRRPGGARPHGGPGAALGATGGDLRVALPPGRRVVALGEADGMPHPATPPNQGLALVSAIPEACPPGEGILRWAALCLLMRRSVKGTEYQSIAVQRCGPSRAVSWETF